MSSTFRFFFVFLFFTILVAQVSLAQNCRHVRLEPFPAHFNSQDVNAWNSLLESIRRNTLNVLDCAIGFQPQNTFFLDLREAIKNTSLVYQPDNSGNHASVRFGQNKIFFHRTLNQMNLLVGLMLHEGIHLLQGSGKPLRWAIPPELLSNNTSFKQQYQTARTFGMDAELECPADFYASEISVIAGAHLASLSASKYNGIFSVVCPELKKIYAHRSDSPNRNANIPPRPTTPPAPTTTHHGIACLSKSSLLTPNQMSSGRSLEVETVALEYRKHALSALNCVFVKGLHDPQLKELASALSAAQILKGDGYNCSKGSSAFVFSSSTMNFCPSFIADANKDPLWSVATVLHEAVHVMQHQQSLSGPLVWRDSPPLPGHIGPVSRECQADYLAGKVIDIAFGTNSYRKNRGYYSNPQAQCLHWESVNISGMLDVLPRATTPTPQSSPQKPIFDRGDCASCDLYGSGQDRCKADRKCPATNAGQPTATPTPPRPTYDRGDCASCDLYSGEGRERCRRDRARTCR